MAGRRKERCREAGQDFASYGRASRVMWSVTVVILGPTPGPAGLIIIFEPDSAKIPPASKLGAPKRTVPVNGEPSSMATEKPATTAPRGVVSDSCGVSGVTVIIGCGETD